MKKIGIVMGSDSDLPVIEKAVSVLREMNIPFEVHIYSAHRTPVEARDFALHARENGFGVIIAAAGMAAHLAGAIAANTMPSRVRMRPRDIELSSWSTTPTGRSSGNPSSSIEVKKSTVISGNTTMQKA